MKRELEDGWFQHVEHAAARRADDSIGINKLRYATLMGIKKAKTKEIKRLTRRGSGRAPAAAAWCAIDKIYAPERDQADADFRGRRQEAAAQLVEKLKFEVRVHMSILAILEQRDGQLESHVVGDAGGGAADSAGAGRAGGSRGASAGNCGDWRGAGIEKAREGVRGRA